MLSWIRTLVRRRPSNDELLNEGLELAMDWGESWLAPINARLHKLHPFLGADRLEECNAACQGAMRLAYETVHVLLCEASAGPSMEALGEVMRVPYPWVNDHNLARLLRQGTYYAAKVGGHRRDV
jgi:hypothetical protein